MYTALQEFVHRGHHRTFDRFVRMLDLKPGASVVEIGCGAGVLAHYFADAGYDYHGLDVDADRVETARARTPCAHFIVANAASMRELDLPDTRTFFIHGVLHHVDDDTCRLIVNDVFSRGADTVLAITEPLRPAHWWHNPLGAWFASMDEGAHVRYQEEWKSLFGSRLSAYATRSLWPRWPVTFIDALLNGAGSPSREARLIDAF